MIKHKKNAMQVMNSLEAKGHPVCRECEKWFNVRSFIHQGRCIRCLARKQKRNYFPANEWVDRYYAKYNQEINWEYFLTQEPYATVGSENAHKEVMLMGEEIAATKALMDALYPERNPIEETNE